MKLKATMEEQKGERILEKCSNVGYARIDKSIRVLYTHPKIALSRGKWGGMRHTSTALYFYGASKKFLHKPRVTFGNMLFKISHSPNYYLQLLCK